MFKEVFLSNSAYENHAENILRICRASSSRSPSSITERDAVTAERFRHAEVVLQTEYRDGFELEEKGS